jgi:hypothetical protein
VASQDYHEVLMRVREHFTRRLSLTCSICGMDVMSRSMADHLWNGSVGVYHWLVKEMWAHVRLEHPELLEKVKKEGKP